MSKQDRAHPRTPEDVVRKYAKTIQELENKYEELSQRVDKVENKLNEPSQ